MSLPPGLKTGCRCNEHLFAALLTQELRLAKLPPQRMVTQHRFDPDSPNRAFDIAFPDLMLAIEVDGWGHRVSQRFRADRQRDRTALELGWHVLRYTTDELNREPGKAAEQVVRVIRHKLELL
jgi:very-short-patch-repair endonuclease